MKHFIDYLSLFLFASLTGLLLFVYLFYGERGELPGYSVQLEGWLASIAAANISVLALSGIDKLFNKKFPWQTAVYYRLMITVLSGMLAVIVVYSAFTFFYFYFQAEEYMMNIESSDYQVFVLKFVLIVFVAIVVRQIIKLTVHSYKLYADSTLASASLSRKQLELQANMLKSQLSPHYLFNSLNTISSLNTKDPVLAEEFIRRLSQTYQYVLTTHEEELISLREEIDFVNAYNFLLRIRFSEAICLNIELPEEAYERKVPPLSIQMLVENAVKHNIIDESEKLTITIQLNHEGNLVIRNNKTDAPKQADSLHIGLENISQRYAMLDQKASYADKEEYYEVSLPLIP